MQVALVACGKAHTVVYTNSGKLFAFGSNAEGQLGVGRTPEFSDVPVELPAADVIREGVAKLAAGSAHSMALGKETGEESLLVRQESNFKEVNDAVPGQIYVWGSNTDGQLGLGPDTEEMMFTPALLRLPSGLDSSVFIRDIRCIQLNIYW